MKTEEKLNEILNGWKNLIFRNSEIEEEAKRRAKICSGCSEVGMRPMVHCKKCGCPLAAKTRSETSKCPLGKW